MSERLPSDSPAIDTHRAELVRLGGTRNQCLRVPDALEGVSPGELIRLVIRGDEYHTVVADDGAGAVVRGAFDNARLARTTGEGTNRLAAWLRSLDRESGSSVELDVVVPGEQFGLRAPGERAVYTVREGPPDSLASIAERLDDDY